MGHGLKIAKFRMMQPFLLVRIGKQDVFTQTRQKDRQGRLGVQMTLYDKVNAKVYSSQCRL